MIDKLIERKDSLKQELEKAQQLVTKKESEIKELREVINRLEGSVQILGETIEEMKKENSDQ